VIDGTANGLVAAIEASFSDLGIQNWHCKLVAMLSDGASVNLGQKKGVAALLKSKSPWLITIHCFNHRLELAVKDSITKHKCFNNVLDLLMTLYNYYHSSPKRLRDVKEVADSLDDHFTKLQRCNGTRWVAFKLKALQSVKKNYGIIVQHLLQDINAGAGHVANVNRSKAKGILAILQNCATILHLLLLENMLVALSGLSETLQGDKVGMLHAIAEVRTCLSQMTVEHLCAGCKELKELVNCITDATAEGSSNDDSDDDCGDVLYRGVRLVKCKQGLKTFNSNKEGYFSSVRNCIEERFADVLGPEANPVIAALKVLDVNCWPKEKSELDVFANEELVSCAYYLQALLVNDVHSVSVERILNEWFVLKNLRYMLLSALKSMEMWKVAFDQYKNRISNLLEIVRVLFVLPVSNAKVERAFSVMKCVKTDWRSSLSSKVLEHLLRIKLEGPDVDSFNSASAAELFFQTPRRQRQKKRKIDHIRPTASGSSFAGLMEHGDDSRPIDDASCSSSASVACIDTDSD
jgi:hAT family C-terminal dimerisation region